MLAAEHVGREGCGAGRDARAAVGDNRLGQVYAGSREYKAYHSALQNQPQLWCPESIEYEGWRQLEHLGLISRGNWP